VACGGTLYQDLSTDGPHSEVVHQGKDGAAPRHTVEIEPGSRVASALGSAGTIEVNSRHHQGLARIGTGLRVTAKAADGLAEALEYEGHPFLIGVQWHPEEMTEDERQGALFASLVRAASEACTR
jgi:putative glutamine amidotransferase